MKKNPPTAADKPLPPESTPLVEHQPPVITPLGGLASLTLGATPGANDGFDGFGGS